MYRYGFVLLALTANAQTLTSGDLTLRFEAGPTAPRVVSLSVKGTPVWQNRTSEKLIGGMRLRPARTVAHRSLVRFVYQSAELRLSWDWQVRSAPGPIEHTIRIENISGHEIWLARQDSLAFDFAVPGQESLSQFWVEKGASSPSDVGVHPSELKNGDTWTGFSSNYGHAGKNNPREMIPYLLVKRGTAGWYAGIEFSGRTRITLSRRGDTVASVFGLNPDPGPFRTRLTPGETFETPTVFVGGFKGDEDDAGNSLRRWIRAALNNPLTLNDTHYPLLVSNSWGSGMAINEQQAHQMIDAAASLGLEMFHVDAGWFRAVGDWASNREKFPQGVGAVADYAHSKGLRFGLWTDWTQAGTSREPGALNVYDPQTRDWLTTDPPPDWKTEDFKGITVDIGVPAARQWAAEKAASIVRDYHLDMLEHDGYLVAEGCDRTDHPHAPADPSTIKHFKDEGSLWVEGNNDTDVSYHATRAYYTVQTHLRRIFPKLLFEICNDGGRMVDFGSAAHGDYFSITDAYDPLSNRRAVYDASYILPSAMLETYVQKVPTPTLDSFRYMLRSGMMGWFSLMLDPSAWAPEQRAAAKAEFAFYKEQLRPLIRAANVYHVSPRPSDESWDGLEYFDPSSGRGVLYAFRSAKASDSSHTFALKSLEASATYRVTYRDHTSPDYSARGSEIMRSGITVTTTSPASSELILMFRN